MRSSSWLSAVGRGSEGRSTFLRNVHDLGESNFAKNSDANRNSTLPPLHPLCLRSY